jgi:hypothetical protein
MCSTESNHELDSYEGGTPSDAEPVRPSAEAARSYIGILFKCCGVYVRVYRRPEQNVYSGRCPNCLRPVRVRVGPEGTNSRIFRAT